MTAPRAATGGVSPVAWIDGHGGGARASRRLRAQPVSADPRRDAATTGGCTHCSTLTMATLPRLVADVGHAFGKRQADLADRVRLPDRPARHVPRRLAREAGALHERGGAARLPRAAGRHADQLPRAGRARHRPLAERHPHHRRQREAVVPGVRAAAHGEVAHQRRRRRSGARSVRATAASPTCSRSSAAARGCRSAALRARARAASSAHVPLEAGRELPRAPAHPRPRQLHRHSGWL